MPLAVAAVLAVVAGCVDAIFFVRVAEVYPANQSGNAVLLGIGIGHAGAGTAWRPAVAILGFGVGVTGAVVLRNWIRHPLRAPLLVALEILLLAPLAIVLVDTAHPAARLTGIESGILLVITAMAMGLQTEVIGRVAGVRVATTYQSGSIAGIAEAAAGAESTARPDRARSFPRLVVLGVVLVAYVAGAALGASFADWRSALLVPIGVLAALGSSLTVAAMRSSFVI